MCILAHMLTEAMLTAMTSLYVAPCESGPPVFLITLHTYTTWTSVAFDVSQKSRNTLAHLSENLKIPVKLLLKHTVLYSF